MNNKEAKRLETVKEYYFSKKLRALKEMTAAGRPIINLGIGSPDLAPDPSVIVALIEAASQPQNHAYQSYKGIDILRRAIAGFYDSYYGVQLDPNREILPLMGSKEAVMHLSLAFLEEGDEVLVPNPGYPAYASTAAIAGATTIKYALQSGNNWQVQLRDLEQLRSGKTKLLWLNYPNMPTGVNADSEGLSAIVSWARENNIILVNDNPYSLVGFESPFSILKSDLRAGNYKGILELNSLSKSHNMAGWRVGMMCGDKELINAALKVKSNMDSGMFKGIQLAAAKALELDVDFHAKRNAIYQKRRTKAEGIATALGCEYSKEQGGMFLWMRISDTFKNALEMSDAILEQCDVFITPGFIFGSQGENYLRISLCNSCEVLEDVLQRIQSKMPQHAELISINNAKINKA